MTKIPCSVPILTLNSGKYLARCLESVKDFEDVFIVDGNSTDETHAIAKRFGVPIYKQVETDEPNVRIADFTAVRSRAYELAKTDWILVLDSDEYITERLRNDIRTALAEHSEEAHTAFLIEKKLVLGEKEIEYAFFKEIAVRLFNKKSGIGYVSGKLVHEKLFIPDTIQCLSLDGVFFSQESPSYAAGIAKDDYYLSLMQEKVTQKIDVPSLPLWQIIKSIGTGILRACKILGVSCFIYVRHGYARSLPVSYAWRHARYHIRLSMLRTRQLCGYFFSL